MADKSDSEDEQIEKKISNTEEVKEEVKPKQKRDYVMTENRAAALERCKAARLVKAKDARESKDNAKQLVKKITEEPKETEEKKTNEKKKKKKSKQVIVIQSESSSDESDEENQIIIRRKRKKESKIAETTVPLEAPPIFRLRRL